MFEKLEEALRAGKFVALTRTADGGIEFAGDYESSRDAYSAFSADSPEGMAAIPQVVFVQLHKMPSPPENL